MSISPYLDLFKKHWAISTTTKSTGNERLGIALSSLLILPSLAITLGLTYWLSGIHPQILSQVWNSACHRQADRSLFFAGQMLPICARCTGLWIGALTGSLLSLHLEAPARTNVPKTWWVGLALSLLGLGDALGRTLIGWDTSAFSRLASGFVLGVGVFYLAGAVIRTIFIQLDVDRLV